MSRFNRNRLSTAEIVGIVAGVIVLSAAAVAFQAWILGLVLSWFGVYLEFWKNVVIVILLNSIFGGSQVSKSN